jgi:hypothetical protein
VSPVKYGLGFYIPEDDILHSHCRENLRSYSISMKLSVTSELQRMFLSLFFWEKEGYFENL